MAGVITSPTESDTDAHAQPRRLARLNDKSSGYWVNINKTGPTGPTAQPKRKIVPVKVPAKVPAAVSSSISAPPATVIDDESFESGQPPPMKKAKQGKAKGTFVISTSIVCLSHLHIVATVIVDESSESGQPPPAKKAKKGKAKGMFMISNGVACLSHLHIVTTVVDDSSILDVDAINEDGLLRDLDHIVIDLPVARPTKTHTPSADIRQFFDNPHMTTVKDSKGNFRKVHDCIICKSVRQFIGHHHILTSICRRKKASKHEFVVDLSTGRRHMAREHKVSVVQCHQSF